MRTPHQQRIEEMMERMGQQVPETPVVPDEETRLLRAKLIMEECLETVEALGFTACIAETDFFGGKDYLDISGEPIEFLADCLPDLTAIADGCADISVVTIGTLSACGIKDQPILEEVDQNNMSKFGEGSHRRDDGKWMKPPDFVGPDIESRLNDQKNKGAVSPEVEHIIDETLTLREELLWKINKGIGKGNGKMYLTKRMEAEAEVLELTLRVKDLEWELIAEKERFLEFRGGLLNILEEESKKASGDEN